MKIDHVRFCVADAKTLKDWFVSRLGFCSLGSGEWNGNYTEVVNADSIYFVFCSPLRSDSSAAHFLSRHPSGVADVALIVPSLDQAIAHAIAHGAILQHPVQTEYQTQGRLRWATLQGWENLTHTLIERIGTTTLLPLGDVAAQHSSLFKTMVDADEGPEEKSGSSSRFVSIDHVVLNVQKGDLTHASGWYEDVLQFQPQQRFEIQTPYSSLYSQVMRHPDGQVQFPINEPGSPNSQIQEFLDVNRGAGIQHIALEMTNLVQAIAQFRAAGLSLIEVPSTYYTQLRDRPLMPFSEEALQVLEAQQILVDWQTEPNSGVLLQTFTQPIFSHPTFFLELIERQIHPLAGQPRRASGFGEGNFRALFEAIEREQAKRGSLA